jgi:hypothetical protein
MPQPIILLKVALVGRKSIWRKIALPANKTLDDLHEFIYDAFDRDDEHLYSFYFPPPGAKFNYRKIRDYLEYTHPYALDGDFCESEAEDAARAKLSSLGLKPKQKFYYLFDFGDEWWHEISVEEIDAARVKGQKYPGIVEKKGKSPPQYPDCDEEEYEEDEEDED